MKSTLELERAAYIGGNKELAELYNRIYAFEEYEDGEGDRLHAAYTQGYDEGKDADLSEEIVRLKDALGVTYGKNQGLCNELQTVAEWLTKDAARYKENRRKVAHDLLLKIHALRGSM